MSLRPPRKSLDELLEHIQTDHRLRSGVAAWKEIPAREAAFAPMPAGLDRRLARALEGRGIKQLYAHQAEAFEAAERGESIAVVTPTASGKTLCFNLPVMNRILREPGARALYLFPTKALSQDQMHALHGLIAEVGADVRTSVYDGDTPADARQAIRSQGHVVITNPDMLHAGILPHHTKWLRLFESLRYVVLDELHAYRGVFGSHLANVIRRLRRVARFYGSDPQFICCSATIANPKELAEKLIEKPVTLVDRNGAPSGEKTFVFWNPPVVNRELGIRRSALKSAQRFAELFLENGVSTILFAGSRLSVEILTKYLKDALRAGASRVEGYRGGYLPTARRAIEKGLREGTLSGVVSTNALELGVDIGALDACVLCGYPGTIAGTWQQAGRAGRRKGRSVVILVARSDPLDQFIVEHPEYFFGASPEHGRVSPDNLLILASHVKCAAFELPFEEGERFGETLPADDVAEVLDYLAEKRVLHKSGGRWHWMAESYPASEVSLRSASPENFVVVDRYAKGGPRIIAEVDWFGAPMTVHPEAIYLCEGVQWHVEELDWERRKAFVKQIDADYYTDAMTYTGVSVLEVFESSAGAAAVVEHGEVHVRSKVVGYKKIKFYTAENVGFGEVHLPEQDLHTTAYWFTVPEPVLAPLNRARSDLIDGFLGLGHALEHVAAMTVMCDVRDIRCVLGDKSAKWFARATAQGPAIFNLEEGKPIEPGGVSLSGRAPAPVDAGIDLFEPTIFLYDAYPGGVGFSPKLFDEHAALLRRTRDLVLRCACAEGCPSCVGPAGEVGRLSKQVALEILDKLILG